MIPTATIGFRCHLRTVEIAGIELRTADQRLARLPDRHILVLVIDNPDVHARRLDAHGSRPHKLVGQMIRHPAHDSAFGAAILVVPMEAVAFDHLRMELLWQPGMDGKPDAVIALVRPTFALHEEGRNRSDRQDLRCIILLNHIPEPRHREAPHGDHRAARGERRQQLNGGVGIVEWQATELPVLPAPPEQPQIDIDHPQPPAMMQHAALWRTGGARGVIHRDDVLTLAFNLAEIQRFEPAAEAAQPVRLLAVEHDDVSETWRIVAHCADDRLLQSAADRCHGLGVLDDVAGIELLRRWCNRYQWAAIGDDREQRDHELDPVVEHHGDVITGPYLASQIAGKDLATLEEILARDDEPVFDDQRGPVGILETALVHDLD